MRYRDHPAKHMSETLPAPTSPVAGRSLLEGGWESWSLVLRGINPQSRLQVTRNKWTRPDYQGKRSATGRNFDLPDLAFFYINPRPIVTFPIQSPGHPARHIKASNWDQPLSGINIEWPTFEASSHVYLWATAFNHDPLMQNVNNCRSSNKAMFLKPDLFILLYVCCPVHRFQQRRLMYRTKIGAAWSTCLEPLEIVSSTTSISILFL